MITFVFNPISLVSRAAEIAFPGINAEVQFVPDLDVKSRMDHYINTGIPMVDISASISLDDALEEMLSVFALIGSGADSRAAKSYTAARKSIQVEFEKLMSESLEGYENK